MAAASAAARRSCSRASRRAVTTLGVSAHTAAEGTATIARLIGDGVQTVARLNQVRVQMRYGAKAAAGGGVNADTSTGGDANAAGGGGGEAGEKARCLPVARSL